MTKRIRVFNTPEELTESAKKNAEYWIDKGLPFAFGRFGDTFMIAPTDENGTQTGNGAQMFFENHEFCGKFFENFRMIVAHTPGRIRGSRISDIYQRIVFVPKKEEEPVPASDLTPSPTQNGVEWHERMAGHQGSFIRIGETDDYKI